MTAAESRESMNSRLMLISKGCSTIPFREKIRRASYEGWSNILVYWYECFDEDVKSLITDGYKVERFPVDDKVKSPRRIMISW